MKYEVDNYNGYPNIHQLNLIFEAIEDIVDQGLQGPPGEDGDDGADGDDGWSPIFAIETDGERRVLLISDWTGGTGTKPATGSYIGSTGLVTDIALAVDIRGPAGEDGMDGANGSDGADGEGVPIGGTAGQVLAKIDSTDYNTEWVDQSGNTTILNNERTVTGTTDTITTADEGGIIFYTSNSAVTVSIDSGLSSRAFITVVQNGDGTVTIDEINRIGGNETWAKGFSIYLYKREDNDWQMIGGVE